MWCEFISTNSDLTLSKEENLDNSTDIDFQNQNQTEIQEDSEPQGSTTPVKIRKRGSNKIRKNMKEAQVYKELTALCIEGRERERIS